MYYVIEQYTEYDDHSYVEVHQFDEELEAHEHAERLNMTNKFVEVFYFVSTKPARWHNLS